jgi:hypothetical protein
MSYYYKCCFRGITTLRTTCFPNACQRSLNPLSSGYYSRSHTLFFVYTSTGTTL